ncbi:seipin-like isoform X3 [Pollicipes pollicipes]|uniref:seipin-like isoform X3 n=1 Tax=Pollicipes pollicipes TaxID=41117 RepID=UPI001884EC42|nr:seipin-like isoform X3 [Pollicipes pollicipes]
MDEALQECFSKLSEICAYLRSTYPGKIVTKYVGNISSFLAKCIVLWLICTILLISSAVLYFTFHYSMMPTMLVSLPVHFQFTPCFSNPESCAYPRAQVYLVDGGANPLLYPHVHYTLTLEMDMPESDANKNAAGMFMAQLNLTSFSGRLVGSSSRANLLHYRSRLHRALRTFLIMPLLFTDYSREQQTVATELFSAYLVHEEHPPTSAQLEVRSHAVQLYAARLRVHARLTGLRRLMYHHPLLSGLVGTLAIFCSVSLVFLLLWLRNTELPQTLARLRRARSSPAAVDASLAADVGGTDEKSSSSKKSSELDKGQAPDDEAPELVYCPDGAATVEEHTTTLECGGRREMSPRTVVASASATAPEPDEGPRLRVLSGPTR